MKIRKNSEVKNFEVDVYCMLYKDLVSLLNKGICEIFYKSTMELVSDYENVDLRNNLYSIRIFTCYCSEIKVVYDDMCGCYQTVVITNDGRKVVVML